MFVRCLESNGFSLYLCLCIRGYETDAINSSATLTTLFAFYKKTIGSIRLNLCCWKAISDFRPVEHNASTTFCYRCWRRGKPPLSLCCFVKLYVLAIRQFEKTLRLQNLVSLRSSQWNGRTDFNETLYRWYIVMYQGCKQSRNKEISHIGTVFERSKFDL